MQQASRGADHAARAGQPKLFGLRSVPASDERVAKSPTRKPAFPRSIDPSYLKVALIGAAVLAVTGLGFTKFDSFSVAVPMPTELRFVQLSEEHPETFSRYLDTAVESCMPADHWSDYVSRRMRVLMGKLALQTVKWRTSPDKVKITKPQMLAWLKRELYPEIKDLAADDTDRALKFIHTLSELSGGDGVIGCIVSSTVVSYD